MYKIHNYSDTERHDYELFRLNHRSRKHRFIGLWIKSVFVNLTKIENILSSKVNAAWYIVVIAVLNISLFYDNELSVPIIIFIFFNSQITK